MLLRIITPKRFTIVLFLTVSIFIFGQSVRENDMGNYLSQCLVNPYPQPPTSEYFSIYNSFTNVDLFRGRIDVNIPILTLKVQDFKYPISLNYLSSGIKVDDLASCVGLGWNLNVPGVISRKVQGLPDELPFEGMLDWGGDDVMNILSNGEGSEYFNNIFQFHFYDPNWNGNGYYTGANGGAWVYGIDVNNVGNAFNDLVRISERQQDGLPDIFNYNTGRQSGKFIFDYQGNIQQIPKTNSNIVFINPDDNLASSTFIITDSDGIKYTYNVRDIQDPYSIQSVDCEQYYNMGGYVPMRESGGSYNYIPLAFVSAWHLSKIDFPNGNEINFDYEADVIRFMSSTSEYFFNSHSVYGSHNCSGDDLMEFSKVGRTIQFIQETRNRLKKISYDGNIIEFNKSSDKREDMFSDNSYSGYKLDNITVKNSIGNVIKKVKFTYNYFQNEYKPYYPEYSWKKLKLEKIEFQDDVGQAIPPYIFTYNETYKIPTFYTHQRDVWGYFKPLATNVQVSKPKFHVYPTDDLNPILNSIYSLYPRNNYNGEHLIANELDGYDMLPSDNEIEWISAYLLEKIQYPTGGADSIVYELNKFRLDDNNVAGPGVRVNKIYKLFSGSLTAGNYLLSEYDYTDDGISTGTVAEVPIVFRFDDFAYGDAGNVSMDNNVWGTISYSQVQNMEDTYVGYKKVTKRLLNTQSSIEQLTSNYYYDFSGSYDKYWDVIYHYYDPISQELVLDTLYKKSKSIIWYDNSTFGYWGGGQTLTYLADHSLKCRHPTLLNPDLDWYRGSLIKEEHFKENQVINSIEYTYDLGLKVDRIYGINSYNLFLLGVEEGSVLVMDGDGFVYQVAEFDAQTVKMRWGLMMYLSGIKNLIKMVTTDYTENGIISKEVNYHYAQNEPYLNKSILDKTSISGSNNEKDLIVLKNVSAYSNTDCFGDYEEQLGSAHNTYVDGVKSNCLDENGLCHECLECVALERNSYLSELVNIYDTYQDCIEDQGNPNEGAASAILRLKAKNELKTIESQNRVILNEVEYCLSGNLTIFNEDISGAILPIQIMKMNLADPITNQTFSYIDNDELVYSNYDEDLLLESFDLFGNLQQYRVKNGITITTIWGYDHTLPIAQIENKTYSEVENTLITVGYTIGSLQDKSESELVVIFNELRARPEMVNAFIKSYTYKPLVGKTSETDPSGRTTYYSYDAFGRLQYIKNDEGEFLNKYEYHYKDE